MERQALNKIKAYTRCKTARIAVVLCTLIIFLSQPVLAANWTSVIGLVISATIGLAGVFLAWLVLIVVQAVNGLLVTLLWCSFTLHPAFYVPYGSGAGFTSEYAAACGTEAVGAYTPQGITDLTRLFLGIMYPMFALALIITAAYFIFMATSPPHRARAKQMLNKIIIAMIIAALSPLIYQTLIVVAGGMTDGVMKIIDEQILMEGGSLFSRLNAGFKALMPINDPGGGALDQILYKLDMTRVLGAVIVLALVAVFWMFAILIVLFRYVAVIFYGILFPLTIGLYMFEFTRNIGRKMLKTTIVWIFTPVIMVFWLAVGLSLLPATAASGNLFTGQFLMMNIAIFIITVPLQLTGILAVLGAIVLAIGQFIPSGVGTTMVAIGGLMQGKGSSAIAGAALKYSGGKLIKGGGKMLASAVLGNTQAATNMIAKPFNAVKSAVGKGINATRGGRARSGVRKAAFGRRGAKPYRKMAGKVGADKAWGATKKAYGEGGVLGVAKLAAESTAKGVKAGLKATGRGLKATGRGLKTGAKAAAGNSLIGRAKSGKVAEGLFGKKLVKASGKAMKSKVGKVLGKALVGMSLSKLTGGLITGADVGKRAVGATWKSIGKGLGKAVNALKKSPGAALRGLSKAGTGLKIAAGGLKIAAGAIRHPITALKKSRAGVGLKSMSKHGGKIAKAMGGISAGAVAGLSLAALSPAAALGAAVVGAGYLANKKLASKGTSLLGVAKKGLGVAKTATVKGAGRMYDAAKAGIGRSVVGRGWRASRRAYNAAGKRGVTALAGRSLRKGMARGVKLGVRKALGEGEYKRFQERAARWRGKPETKFGKMMAKTKLGRGTMDAAALGVAGFRSGVQKMAGFTDDQVNAMDKRDTALKTKSSLDNQRDRIGNVIAKNGRGIDKLTNDEVKTLGGLKYGESGASGRADLRGDLATDLGGMSKDDKKLLTGKVNNHFDGKVGELNTKKRVNELGKQKGKIGGVIANNGAGIDKLTNDEVKTLGGLKYGESGASGRADLRGDLATDLGGMGADDKEQLTGKVNSHFDDKIGKIDTSGSIGSKEITDTKKSKRKLSEDAKHSGTAGDTARQEAQEKTGGDRIAGIENAEYLSDQNPISWEDRNGNRQHMDTTTASDLSEHGIESRGDLAGMNDEQMDKIVEGGKYTKGELEGMRESADESTKREATSGEQYELDKGADPSDLIDKRARDRMLKDAISNSGPGKQPDKEDFLTAMEEEQQPPGG